MYKGINRHTKIKSESQLIICDNILITSVIAPHEYICECKEFKMDRKSPLVVLDLNKKLKSMPDYDSILFALSLEIFIIYFALKGQSLFDEDKIQSFNYHFDKNKMWLEKAFYIKSLSIEGLLISKCLKDAIPVLKYTLLFESKNMFLWVSV